MPRAAWYLAGAAVTAGVSFATAVVREEPAASVPVDGAALFVVKGCATCHDGPRSSSMTGSGPSLAEAASWAGERVEGITAAEYLEQSMRSPSAVISPAWSGPNGPTVGMPLLQLADAEIDALVDFLLGSD